MRITSSPKCMTRREMAGEMIGKTEVRPSPEANWSGACNEVCSAGHLVKQARGVATELLTRC